MFYFISQKLIGSFVFFETNLRYMFVDNIFYLRYSLYFLLCERLQKSYGGGGGKLIIDWFRWISFPKQLHKFTETLYFLFHYKVINLFHDKLSTHKYTRTKHTQSQIFNSLHCFVLCPPPYGYRPNRQSIIYPNFQNYQFS